MAEDEVGTLGPKDTAGIDKGYLRGKTWNATAKPAKGAPVVSVPDLKLPDAEALETEKLFPVRMLRGYRPATTHFTVGHFAQDDKGNEVGEPIFLAPEPFDETIMDAGMELKIAAGKLAMIPVTEAKAIIKKGIAERADAID